VSLLVQGVSVNSIHPMAGGFSLNLEFPGPRPHSGSMSSPALQAAPAPLVLRTTGTVRSASIVEAVLDRVALEGERTFSALRVLALALITVVWAIGTRGELVEGGKTAWLVLAITGVGGICAAIFHRVVRGRSKGSRWISLWSVLLDMCLSAALLLGIVFYPPEDYAGVVHISGFSIVAVAVAGAGLRLSRRNAVIAGVVAIVIVVVAFVIDQDINAGVAFDSPVGLATATVILVIAGIVGWTMAHRTRTVALQAAQQSLLAERARAHLGAYVSEEVAALSLHHDELSLSGARIRAAIIFTDLRGFTSMSEQADPAVMVADLNEYFQAMVAAIGAHDGVVDKYIGDSIMAVFGVPSSRGDDAGNALAAAVAMERALRQLNARRGARGAAPLQHGIGVHAGDVIAGNIGTNTRTQYTVIGDAVNVAARLESETKKQGVTVLASQEVVDAAKLVPEGFVRAGGEDGVVVKGRGQAIKVFTVQLS